MICPHCRAELDYEVGACFSCGTLLPAKWVLEDIAFTGVYFRPSWKLVDSKGQGTGKFKGVVGNRSIAFEDLPKDLQERLRKFVEDVLNG